MVLRERGDNLVLREIGVLVLVDQHVAKTVVQLAPQLRIFGQNRHHVQQQVVEVDRVRLQEPLLILGIDARDDRLQMVADRLFKRAHELVGGLEFVFSPR